MPVVDLPDISEPAGRLRALHTISAVMAWPNDHGMRDQYTATVSARALDQAGESYKALGEWFLESGGFSSVAMAPGSAHFEGEFDRRYQQWWAAGLVVQFVWQMAAHHEQDLKGGASINKAMAALEWLGDGNLLPKSSRHCWRAWNSYRSVAHFCAAFVYVNQRLIQRALDDELSEDAIGEELGRRMWEGLEEFLGIVGAFEDFGLAYRLPRSKDTLLRAGELWELPALVEWPVLGIKPWPLPDDVLRVVRDYSAPRDYY